MAFVSADGGSPRRRVVLLHGWGSSAAVFSGFAAELRGFADVTTLELPAHGARRSEPFPANVEVLLEWLRSQVPAGSVLIGWSLGGLLGLHLAMRHPRHLAGLVTIATSPCFLSRSDWPFGMEHGAWDAFRDELVRDPAALLARFAALQSRGEHRARELARTLRAAAGTVPESTDGLLLALDALGVPDLRRQLAAIETPVLAVFGEHDAIVDARIADEWLRLQPGASVWVVPGAGHCPFLGAPRALAARIEDFIATRLETLEWTAPCKHAIAESFGRAASGYEAAAALQRRTGAMLLELLPPGGAARVLDLGSGTGHFSGVLAARFTAAQIVGIDLAEGMVRHASATVGGVGCGIGWVRGDAEQLPLASASIDLVFSNLALQWCASPLPALREVARVLARGGRAVIATLADDTLWELRAAWRAVDRGVHVNRFESIAALRAAVPMAGLRLRVLEQCYLRVAYRDVRTLAHELRALGAHNINPGRAPGLAGRHAWARLQGAYALLADAAGMLPASWRIVRLVLERADG